MALRGAPRQLAGDSPLYRYAGSEAPGRQAGGRVDGVVVVLCWAGDRLLERIPVRAWTATFRLNCLSGAKVTGRSATQAWSCRHRRNALAVRSEVALLYERCPHRGFVVQEYRLCRVVGCKQEHFTTLPWRLLTPPNSCALIYPWCAPRVRAESESLSLLTCSGRGEEFVSLWPLHFARQLWQMCLPTILLSGTNTRQHKHCSIQQIGVHI